MDTKMPIRPQPPDVASQSDERTASNVLSAAREYAEAGLDTYPVWPGGPLGGTPKAPACGHGYKDATRDPQQLIRWFADGSKAVAIRTGLVNAGEHAGMYLVGIDADSPKEEGGADGMENLRRWQAGEIDGRRHELPPTLEATTPNGGRHLYYWSKRAHGCTANADLRIDVRCAGGGIIAPPSVVARRDGTPGRYEWVGGRFDPALIAEANEDVEALIDLVFAKRKPKGAAVFTSESSEGQLADDGPTPEYEPYVRPARVRVGARHNETARYSGHLQALGYSDDEVARRVFDFVETTCEQPIGDEMAEEEVWQIINWALSKPKGSALKRRLTPLREGDAIDSKREARGDGAPSDEDAPSDEEARVKKYVRGVIERFAVFEEGKDGKVSFHASRLTNAFIYGLHACTIGGAPAIWDGRHYIFGPESIRYLMELACPSASATANAGAVKKVLARLMVERRFEATNPGLVRFTNCVYDCATGEVRKSDEASWQERIPNPIPHPLDMEAKPVPVVDQFLDGLSDGHADIRRNLLEIIFLSVTRYIHHEQAVVLIGSGANGKSRFVDVVLRIVGTDNASFLSLDRMANRFEVGDLAGRTLNISSDISSEYLSGEKTSVWKQATGGDVLKADVKNLPGYSFRPYSLLVIVGNGLPKMQGGIDKATSRRLHIVPFTHSYRDASGGYTDDADPQIVEKVCEPDAMKYLIRLSMEAGRRMLSEREFRFSPNYLCEQEVHRLAIDNSSVLAWSEHVGLVARDLHMQRKQTMYERYSMWCKRTSLKAVSANRFADELRTQFPELEFQKVRADRYEMNVAGRMYHDRVVQYSAYVVSELYDREREEHAEYAEMVATRERVTSYTYDSHSGRRETYRIEEVNLGVWPIKKEQIPAAEACGLREKLFADLARYEE